MSLNLKSLKGFTLVELVIVIAILGVLITITTIVLDPVAQIKKSRDARRYHDLIEIRNALDSYQNDYQEYPGSIQFGESLIGGSTIYMKQIPKDPLCSAENCSDDYLYVVDPNHKWFLVFAKQEIRSMGFSQCRFTCVSIPNLADYAGRTSVDLSQYKYCVVGGDVNKDVCPLMQPSITPFYYQNPVTPTPTPSPTPTPTLTPVQSPTQSPAPSVSPTPTSTPSPTPNERPICVNGYYYCGCSAFGVTSCQVTFTRPTDRNIIYYCDQNCSGQCGRPC